LKIGARKRKRGLWRRAFPESVKTAMKRTALRR
jgi:hypothetical protein